MEKKDTDHETGRFFCLERTLLPGTRLSCATDVGGVATSTNHNYFAIYHCLCRAADSQLHLWPIYLSCPWGEILATPTTCLRTRRHRQKPDSALIRRVQASETYSGGHWPFIGRGNWGSFRTNLRDAWPPAPASKRWAFATLTTRRPPARSTRRARRRRQPRRRPSAAPPIRCTPA